MTTATFNLAAFALAAFAFAAFALAACATHPATRNTAVAPQPLAPPPTTESPAAVPGGAAVTGGSLSTGAQPSWADSILSTLTLRQKAAQLVWPNLFGDYVASDAASWRKIVHAVVDEQVGGVLMSVGSPIEIAVKLNALQRMAPIPLLVSADLEYGAGMRARGGYFVPNGIDLGGATVFPPQMAFGAARDTDLAYEEGRITAIEGRALGIHIDFAPVLDVNNNPNNPVINTRSYGEDPALVAALGRQFIRGLQEHGMIATGKHFPGHGDTETNSHLALPVVRVSRARLDTVELVPFRAAVAVDVGLMMTFHGSMPALDSSGLPGTLSPAVLTKLLRQEMGFKGIVVSDAMDMGAIVSQFGAAESIKRAVAAGADILIQPVDATQAIDAVVAGVQEGRYTESRIDSSVHRILELKHELHLDQQRFVDLDSLRAVVGDSANQAMAHHIAELSITLVKDSVYQLPLGKLPATKRLLSVTVAHRSDLAAGVAFAAELRTKYPNLRMEFIDADVPFDAPQRILREADSADVTIVGSYVGPSDHALTISAPDTIVSFIRQLTARRKRPIVVAFGNPYFLQQVPDVPTYVVAWGGLPVSQQAAARAIEGTIYIEGQLPIAIPPYALFGGGGKPAPPCEWVQVPTGPGAQPESNQIGKEAHNRACTENHIEGRSAK